MIICGESDFHLPAYGQHGAVIVKLLESKYMKKKLCALDVFKQQQNATIMQISQVCKHDLYDTSKRGNTKSRELILAIQIFTTQIQVKTYFDSVDFCSTQALTTKAFSSLGKSMIMIISVAY